MSHFSESIWLPFFVLIGVFAVIFLAVCGYSWLSGPYITGEKYPDERIDNVARVLMHEPGYYSILVKEKNNNLVCRSFGQYGRVSVKIIADVQSDQPMWAQVFPNLIERDSTFYPLCNYSEKYDPYVEIHIHSGKDIDGAGWDHGKFGRGKTNVIN